MKYALVTNGILASLLVACSNSSQAVPMAQAQVQALDQRGGVRTGACEGRSKETLDGLLACMTRTMLWHRLEHFQRIADANPGSDGHGNRDTGTPGYVASVAYVAGLMRAAGYDVTVQRYRYRASQVTGTPQFRTAGHAYAFEDDWFVARNSAGGVVTGTVTPPRYSLDGCSEHDFHGFASGNIALLQRGDCGVDSQVAHAQAAGARAVILYNARDRFEPDGVGAFEARLIDPARIPVLGMASYAVGADLRNRYRTGAPAVGHIEVRVRATNGIDENVIADSRFGNAKRVVVVDAHLDSIYGAGMLDNASGSTTLLEVALNLAKTPTVNRVRYIWFGGEELGLLGSRYYTQHLNAAQLRQIAFDVDVDVTATPNFDILVADPAYASNVQHFPHNVVPESRLGNDAFTDFFATGGVVSRPARFGNDGTDSNSFSLAGVPNSGILTQQDCCKHTWETQLWGGFQGNYEGDIPSFDGGCVDRPHRWCDNLSNNDPFVLELASKASAFVTFTLANDTTLGR